MNRIEKIDQFEPVGSSFGTEEGSESLGALGEGDDMSDICFLVLYLVTLTAQGP